MASHLAGPTGPDPAGCTKTGRLLAWQATGDHDSFALLVESIRVDVAAVARPLLARHGCRGLTAVDEVLALVLDHLRRLASEGSREDCVARFRPGPAGDEDAGERYITWLTRIRTHDFLRSRRRRSRRSPTFTDMLGRHGDGDRPSPDGPGSGDRESQGQDNARRECLHEALDALGPASRRLMEMILAGTTQKAIADLLGVCEGTVSRRRTAVLARIRDFVKRHPPVDGME